MEKEQTKKPKDTQEYQSIDTVSGAVSKNWVFYQEPLREDILKKLEKLPNTGAVHVKNYVDYVVAIPQKATIVVENREEKMVVWIPYVQVAGRIQMFNDDMEKRGLCGLIFPDPNVPDKNPYGWVYQDDSRLVYRVIIEVRNLEGTIISKRAGTTWVPWTGGGFVIANSRFEKAETSATGRALASMGYGVLPGSGVASYDEMQAVDSLIEPDNRKNAKTERLRELTSLIDRFVALSGQDRKNIMDGIDSMSEKNFKKSIHGPKGLNSLMITEIEYFIQIMYKRIADEESKDNS